MTIEFSCSHCDKVLKTSDDKAGRRAKCPQCGEPITVPAAETPADDGFDGFDEVEESVPEQESFLAGDAIPEENSFLAGQTTDCPMCGEAVPAGASKCPACGETLKATSRSGGKRWEPRIMNISDVFSRSWEVYKANLGLAIAVPLVAGVIYMFGAFVIGMIMGLMQVALVGGNPGNPGQGGDIGVALLFAMIQNIFVYSIYFYLQLGGQMVFLQLVRGENPEFSVLFNGGPYFLRMFACSIIFGILVALGMVLLIIPGIILALMFWPYSFVLIDRNLPGIESFSEAKKVTAGNLLNAFGLFLILWLITVFGVIITLGIGAIFIMPFTYMVQTVAYAEMTSQ